MGLESTTNAFAGDKAHSLADVEGECREVTQGQESTLPVVRIVHVVVAVVAEEVAEVAHAHILHHDQHRLYAERNVIAHVHVCSAVIGFYVKPEVVTQPISCTTLG